MVGYNPWGQKELDVTEATEHACLQRVAQMVKNLSTVQETWVRSLGWEDPLEKGMATHSSILLNSMERGTVHWVAKNWTRLSDFHFHAIIQFLLFKSNTKFAILYRQIIHCLSVSLRVKVEIPSMASRMLCDLLSLPL